MRYFGPLGQRILIPKAMWLPGVAGNYASTPDSVALSILGDIDLMARIAPDSWVPAVQNRIICKRNATTAYDFYLDTNGTLGLYKGAFAISSSVATGFAAGTTRWVRATRASGTGTVQFFTAADSPSAPSTWTQLGTSQADTAGAIADTADPVFIGMFGDGAIGPFKGKIYRAQIYNGIGGTLVGDFNARLGSGKELFKAVTGEPWTINSSGAITASINPA